MTQGIATTKYVRITPRKARLVADLIRGKDIGQAKAQLLFSNCKAGRLIEKTLDSAVANAETQTEARVEELRVLEIRVDDGPTMKRARSKNRGGRHPILKRTSHFTVVVGY